ncbi:MAG: transcription-repair coupling factor [Ruminococcaceae bacterium]|nr:transcription-repair coupling factor [Oscillospiraceae bacterium]
MKYLDWIFHSVPVFKDLCDDITSGSLPALVNGPAGIHKTHAAAAFTGLAPAVMLIAADEPEATRFTADLQSMGISAHYYPVRDFSFHPLESISREFEHSRIDTLCALLDGSCRVVVTVADAVMQYTLPPEQLATRCLTLKPGAEYSIEHIARALSANGYQRADCVEGTGQFSIRGGIIDLFPPSCTQPVRVEMFGDEIDTINYFDTESQRRTEPVDCVSLYPASELAVPDPAALADRLEQLAAKLRGAAAQAARETLYREAEGLRAGIIPAACDKFLPLICDRPATLFDYLPADALILASEHTAIRERAHSFRERLEEETRQLLEDGTLCKGLTDFAITADELWHRLSSRTVFMDTFPHGNLPIKLRSIRTVDARQLPLWNDTVASLIDDLSPLLSMNYAVALLAGAPKAARSLSEQLCEQEISAFYAEDAQQLTPGKVTVLPGSLTYGFDYPDARVALISWGCFSGVSNRPAAPRPHHRRENEIQSLSELSVGDYIVHVNHGIGVFCGIVKLTNYGVVRDFIKISYAKADTLYVPVTQLDLVSKYIGSKDDAKVKLSSLNSGEWTRHKQRVRKAVKDIAKQLIELYAKRMQAVGYSFDPDTEFQRDFEARFPYNETEDQLRSIAEIKHDMESPQPMDRLLCGDVGFGKTEVALRAAFKCIIEGRQCAFLAPTTILAWQHYQTALQRFEGFPFRIALMSRFRTKKQQEETLSQLRQGKVDLLIGTHRIIQQDVKFRDLGLAIIDEEQRFGVAHKERFKELFTSVDQLTLSATPIPRTLNMAMTGLRDISSLDEPPVNRLPVQTYVMEYNEAIVADAIRRELRRGGQIYYLHNKVGDIELVAKRLQALVPEVRIGIAHGQMTEQQISKEWKRLLDHDIDLLLCTTIIESGVDIPNANTLIVENSDHFGLSQLHQLRGRVGRSSRRAYAYLTFSKGRALSDIATKRLSAIREFTQFGSGLKIASRDLQLRGAGNLLGGEQSGHLDLVGYDLYLKMLHEAVQEEQGEPVVGGIDVQCSVDLPIDAHIPESYIEATTLRLDVYRLIADIRSPDDASDVVDELIDRFGDPPAAVMGLINVALARNLAASFGITEIKKNDTKLLFYFGDESALDYDLIGKLSHALPRRVALSPGGKPYMAVKLQPDLSLLENVTSILNSLKAASETE